MANEISNILRTKIFPHPGKYLGFSSNNVKNKVNLFSFLEESCWEDQRLERELLSPTSKEILLKATILAIPVYAMACFLLPKKLCQTIDQKQKNFWWGQLKKIHWISWDKLRSSKSDGSLGLRDLHNFNIALFAKQGWRLISQPNSLWAQVMKSIYYPSRSFLHAKNRKWGSWGWRSLIKGRDLLKKGMHWEVGNGQDIDIWKDT